MKHSDSSCSSSMSGRPKNWLPVLPFLVLPLLAQPLSAVSTGSSLAAVHHVVQQHQAKGVVVDELGHPMMGVTVMVVGTKSVTQTNAKGEFAISVKKGEKLRFSIIGCQTQTMVWKGGAVHLKMFAKENNLNEVVVVGYGKSTKRDLIASVSTVKADQIANIPVTNMAQGLAGRSPGLIVQAKGGGINSMPHISIRGGGEPIYVIDGVIRSKDDFASLSSDDIANLSILKDASSTAVYGSRATNGIIQVTTKKGQEGKAVIEYDFLMSYAQPSIWPEKMASWERAKYANIASQNDGGEVLFSPAAIQAMQDGSDPLNYNNTNWRKLVLRDWAPQQKHTIRITGGNEWNKYYMSLGRVDQNSLYKNNNHWMKRTNFRLANSSYIRPIDLEVNVALDGYVHIDTHPYTSTASGYYQVFSHINDKNPLLPGVNKDGLPYNLTDNPVAETAKDAGYNRHKNNVINGKGELIWKVPGVKGLRLRAASNYRFYSEVVKQWRKDAAQYDWEGQVPLFANKPLLKHVNSTGYSFTNQAFAEYANDWGKHHVSALAGFEQYYEKTEQYGLQRENYEFDIDQIGVGDANTQTNEGWEGELGRAAWIAQAKYNYDNKYYVEGSLRRDGSDRFAPGKRWGNFYSGALGWIVTQEKFMQTLVDKNILNMLKLRASYGETGLDASAGRFQYMSSYTYNPLAYVLDGQYKPGFTEGNLPSPDLTWYTTKQFDLGFDFSTLNRRLYGSFDYFYYTTKGYLTAPKGESYINTAIGIGLPRIKSDSELRRAGFEMQLGWRDRLGDFKYNVAANFTYFDELWALNENEDEAAVMNPYQRGQQQTGFYGLLLHNLGFYQSAEDVYNSVGVPNSFNSGYLTAGDIQYEDVNGDGQITGADKRRLGKANKPRGQYGLTVNMSYKGFYFSTLFQGSTSFDMYLPASIGMKTGQTGQLPVAFEHQTDFWTPQNTGAKYPRLMANTNLNANNNYHGSDFWLVNGRYLRMKDFQFGYDFKYKLLQNVKWLSKLKVGVSGQNIFTLSKVKKYGLDPENASAENYSYPVERTLAFTLNLGF